MAIQLTPPLHDHYYHYYITTASATTTTSTAGTLAATCGFTSTTAAAAATRSATSTSTIITHAYRHGCFCTVLFCLPCTTSTASTITAAALQFFLIARALQQALRLQARKSQAVCTRIQHHHLCIGTSWTPCSIFQNAPYTYSNMYPERAFPNPAVDGGHLALRYTPYGMGSTMSLGS